MEKEKTVFISVPMSGKDDALIERSIQLAKQHYCRTKKVNPKEVYFFDNFNYMKDICENDRGIKHMTEKANWPSVYYLSSALHWLSLCDEAIFGHGWEKAKGCQVEHDVCETYGIPMIIMD